MKNCKDCPAYNKSALQSLGIDTKDVDYIIALAGNPNTGKSTVFNNLTGLRQHTGNWPGKTVSRAEGAYTYNQKTYKIVDLPGTYSLLSTSTDEEVARNFILFGKPDVTVIIMDASRLERNLNIALQVFEITDKIVIALNLMDEAKRHGIAIDVNQLSKELGVPVVPIIAIDKMGMTELLNTIEDVATGKYVCKPRKIITTSDKLKGAIDQIEEELKKIYPNLSNIRWIAIRILEGDQQIIDSVRNGTIIGDEEKIAQ